MPQKNGTAASNRPLGPLGVGKVQHFSAISGASRTATAQAEGGFMISAPLPEISHLLLLASSQANTSRGSTGTSRLNHSSTCLVASELTVMLPSWSGQGALRGIFDITLQETIQPSCCGLPPV